MPTYIKYKYNFLLHFDFRFKVGSEFFSQLIRIRIQEKKIWILIPALNMHLFGEKK